MRWALAALTAVVFFGMAAVAAEALGDVFGQVDATPWGIQREAVLRSLPDRPLLENEETIILPWNIAGREATVNFVFNKAGALYNLAWYALIPVADMQIAQSMEKSMVADLEARYGKPRHVFSDGNARDAAKVARDAPRKAKEREKIAREIMERNKRGKPNDKQAAADLMRVMKVMPTIFYSKLAFWDAGPVWAYTNLLCSTDGTCYLHLQFVSKDLTRDESYFPTPEKAFSYSPLDRDQDLVTKYNRTHAMRKAGSAAPMP